MPELPEVETLCRQLQKKVCGNKILSTEVYDNKLAAVGKLKAGRIIEIERKGKTICIHLEDEHSVSIHLRMTGRLFWQESKDGPKHSRWRMTFKEGNIFLVDPRRFATVKVESTRREKIVNDLLKDFDKKPFLEKQARRNVNIKNLLMDPKAIAGIGNIYACEILHRSGISPLRSASSLSAEEWNKIFKYAKKILIRGIKKRGTSISDWRDLYGMKGENQHELKVYGQEGGKCLMCGGKICRIKQGGRSTFYCSHCQN